MKTAWSGLLTSGHCNLLVIALYRLDKNGKLLKLLRNLITTVCFKDRKWISKTVYCISKIIFCSEFLDIPDKACKKTERRRRTKAFAMRYAFYANNNTGSKTLFNLPCTFLETVISNYSLCVTRDPKYINKEWKKQFVSISTFFKKIPLENKII